MRRCHGLRNRIGQHGHAIAETIIGMLAFAPLLIGIPLLGKQLDIKQKIFEGARYDLWERTVWQSQGANNVKSVEVIARETRDRIMGNPLAGVLDPATMQDVGATENYLWRDSNNRPLLQAGGGNSPALKDSMQPSPVEVGKLFVKSAAHGSGAFSALKLSGWKSLELTRESFATTVVWAELRPELFRNPESTLAQTAQGAILTDTWSSRDEREFRQRVGNLTVNEAVWTVETPGMALGALGSKGKALTGEAQYGWGSGGLSKGPDVTTPSTVVPAEYQHD